MDSNIPTGNKGYHTQNVGTHSHKLVVDSGGYQPSIIVEDGSHENLCGKTFYNADVATRYALHQLPIGKKYRVKILPYHIAVTIDKYKTYNDGIICGGTHNFTSNRGNEVYEKRTIHPGNNPNYPNGLREESIIRGHNVTSVIIDDTNFVNNSCGTVPAGVFPQYSEQEIREATPTRIKVINYIEDCFDKCVSKFYQLKNKLFK